MRTAIAFDTLAYAKRLKAAGVPEAQAEIQAETIVELMEERLATKLDIENVRRDMKEIEAGLKRDIELVRRDMKEIEAGLKRDMKEMELRLTHNLTLRLGGMMAASIGIVAALVKLL